MAHLIASMDLAQVLAEAEDIARSVNQKLTSAHQLLAFFTVPNRAEALLRERGIDEDRLLAAMTEKPAEPDGIERDLRERAREVAEGLAASEIDCLHLLIAMSRVRASAAHQLLSACGVQLSSLRNLALSYFTSGMPRRLRALSPVPVALRNAARATSLAAPKHKPTDPTVASAAEVSRASPISPAGPSPAPEPAQRESPRVATQASTNPTPGSAYALDPTEYPWLSSLGRNLTELAAFERLDPIVGREKEIEQAIDVLGKRRTNNPLLVGDPGVGKTAVVEGIAQRLLKQRGAERLVIEVDMASIVAGTHLRGAFSEKMNGIKEEVRRAGGRIIVFIDEIHTIMGAGAAGDGPQDASNELKAALARGEFPCIGATTHQEYRQHVEKDPALERRFTPIPVREPSVPDTVRILGGLVARYEKHHGISYATGALQAAAALTARYVTDRCLPDKAVAALDLAGSRARRENKQQVQGDDVARVVAEMAGVPESRLVANDRERIQHLEKSLAEHIESHEDVVHGIAAILRRNYAGFSARRPMGSFLLAGPTGVGKTELARALANALYGTRDALVQVDMSECAEPTGVARLIGAAPGYVGYGDGGHLTDAVKRRPACVVVLDEIEKAHRDVMMLLLQVLDEGRLTDGRGREADFSNAVVILTTNLGAAEATRTSTGVVGFGVPDATSSRQERALAAARAAIPPELWNRIDEKFALQPLTRVAVKRIALRLLAESSRQLEAERGIRFRAGDDVADHILANGGFDPTLGARPVRAGLQRLVEAPIAEQILGGRVRQGDSLHLSVRGGSLRIERV